MSHVTRTPLSRSEGQRSMSQGQGDSLLLLRDNRDLASEEGAVGKVRQRSDKSKRV